MTIPKSFIDQILDRSDIVDIVSRFVQLERKGANYWGLCPFHTHEKNKANMSVNQNMQIYKCFSCGASGNAITFLMEKEGLEFIEAIETMATYLGIEVPKSNYIKSDNKTLIINEEAKKIYMEQLASKEGSKAAAYLKNRNLSGQTALYFQLGYSLNEWEGLYKKLSMKFNQKELQDSKLFSEKLKDKFRGRVMFPIRNLQGECIGFGGRTIVNDSAKYFNSAASSTYNKSAELYGLYEVRLKNKNPDFLFVVEGYMDVIALYEKGISNAVANLGTALTSLQLSKISRYTKEVFITFDGDDAGKAAAWSALENSLSILKEGLTIKFIFLEEGHDPDSFVNEYGKDAFLDLRNTAIPLADLLLNKLRSMDDINTIDGRAKIAQEGLKYINKIKSLTYKEVYTREISKICDMDLSKLADSPKQSNKPNHILQGKKVEDISSPKKTNTKKRAAINIFYSILHYPNLVKDNISLITEINSQYQELTDIILKFDGLESANAGNIIELIKNKNLKDMFTEAAMLELNINEETASTMFLDSLKIFINNEKDREEILKEKYNNKNLDSAERRELQKIILKKHNITESDKELIRDLSKKN